MQLKRLPAVAVLVLVLVLLLGGATTAVRGSDVCTFATQVRAGTTRVGFASVDAVRTCFEAIALDGGIRNSTLSVLAVLNALYQFTDIATGSGPPYNISVDLVAEVARVARSTYATDYAFHADLQLVYARLFDGHTSYTPPQPYQQFLAFRPFILGSTGSPDALANQSFYVVGTAAILSSVTFNDAAAFANVSVPALRPYVGERIVSINGLAPRDYLLQLAGFYGVYKDPGYGKSRGGGLEGRREGGLEGLRMGLPGLRAGLRACGHP